MKDKLKEYIGYILLALIIIAGTFARDYIDKKTKKQEWSVQQLAQDVEKYSILHALLTELRVKTDADRAVVYFFHNGGFFSNGMPYKKMSIAYESVKTGVSPELNNSQNLPLSQFSEALKELLVNDGPVFSHISEMKGSNWKYFLQNQGISSSYKRKLIINNQIIGFIEVQYSNENKLPNQNEIKLIENYCSRIEGHVLRAR